MEIFWSQPVTLLIPAVGERRHSPLTEVGRQLYRSLTIFGHSEKSTVAADPLFDVAHTTHNVPFYGQCLSVKMHLQSILQSARYLPTLDFWPIHALITFVGKMNFFIASFHLYLGTFRPSGSWSWDTHNRNQSGPGASQFHRLLSALETVNVEGT